MAKMAAPAEGDTVVKKSLADVVEQLQELNETMMFMAQNASKIGSVRINQGKLRKIFNWLRLRETRKGAKARLAELNELHNLNIAQARYDAEHQQEDMEMEKAQQEHDIASDLAQVEGDAELRAEISKQSKYLDDIEVNQENILAELEMQTSQLEAIAGLDRGDSGGEGPIRIEGIDRLESIPTTLSSIHSELTLMLF